jgi:nitrogen-specific signal transduction histidine kinase
MERQQPRRCRAERSERRLTASGTPSPADNGAPAAPASRAEVSDLGRALGELELLQKLNRAIIHNIPSGIAVLDPDGRLLYFNASFERLWQVRACDLGQPLGSLAAVGPLAAIDWPGEVRRLTERGRPLPDNIIETGSGPERRTIRYGLFSLPPTDFDLPVKLVGEEFCLGFLAPTECPNDCDQCYAHSATWAGAHALLLVDDITEQRQLEAQLIQSEKLAAMGQLSAGVAHEMRNPLSAIYNAAFYIGDVLTDEEPELSEIHEYVALIQRNVDRAQRTVTNILDFARPSGSGRTAADLTELADQTLAILDKALVDQGVELQRATEPGCLVLCRPETVKQALLNLLVNALQAMPEGGVLTLASGASETAGWLTVGDTGSGIAPELLGSIFNPFFTTKPAGQGTGLGLSIARQAIEADGGWLEVESSVGAGTSFRLSLPAAAVEPAVAPPSALAAVSAAAGGGD